MAQVSISMLNYLNNDDEDDDVIINGLQNSVIIEDDLPSSPYYWANGFRNFHIYTDAPPDLSDFQISRTNFPLHDVVSEPDSVDLFDRENQVSFVMDLFQQRVEQSQSSGPGSTRVVLGPDLIHSEPGLEASFGLVEGNDVMGLSSLDLDFGLGLGFCGEDRDGPGPEELVTGLRVVDIGSDSDPDENCIGGRIFNVDEVDGEDDDDEEDDPSVRLCWDSFQLEDDHRRDVNEDFEWEEIDGRVDEREILSMFLDDEEEEIAGPNVVREERVRELENLEWEFLLNVHNLEPDPEIENVEFDFARHIDDQDDYNYTTEYELLFGQFTEGENGLVGGRPPASKIVVKNLPVVVLSKDDLEKNNATTCAICKDEMNLGEKARQLPCDHRYHGNCILPWLGIRNTCPVCRYELPTDDPDYERRRRVPAQRVGQLD